MQMQYKVIIILALLHFTFEGYPQKVNVTDLVYQVNCSSVSSGFAYKHNNKYGILTTLHSVCNCPEENITVTKEKIVNGQGVKDPASIMEDFSITYIDVNHDVAFIESENFSPEKFLSKSPESTFDEVWKNQSPLDAFGFPYLIVLNTPLALNKYRPKTLNLEGLLQGHTGATFSKKSTLPILKTLVLQYDYNSLIKAGWSGGPIVNENGSKQILFSMVNGGFNALNTPIVFGIDLSDLNLCQLSTGKCQSIESICNMYKEAKLFYSGERPREEVVDAKIQELEIRFESYFKYLFPIFRKRDTIPDLILLNASNDQTNSTKPIYIEYSRRIKLRSKEEDREPLNICLVARKDWDGINLYVEFKKKSGNTYVPDDRPNYRPIRLNYEIGDQGYRFWKISDQLIKSLKFEDWFKLVYINVEAIQVSENIVKVILYEQNEEGSIRTRKSYITYPEAKEEDLILSNSVTIERE